tara:strand:- start:1661 stop:2110 length:450 start_codon:yes stop_codon:yes gene_type:complete
LKKITITIFVFFISLLFSSKITNTDKIVGNGVYTDDIGNEFIHVNVIGHVKFPGTHMIFNGANLLDIISLAGGPLQGANLKKVMIYSGETLYTEVDLDKYLKNKGILDLDIEPNTTIYIEQKFLSYIFSRNTNLITSLLQIMNIYLTIK